VSEGGAAAEAEAMSEEGFRGLQEEVLAGLGLFDQDVLDEMERDLWGLGLAMM
jgi:hypothetical protein